MPSTENDAAPSDMHELLAKLTPRQRFGISAASILIVAWCAYYVFFVA